MGGVVESGGPVLDRDAAPEFLVGGAGGATVPLPQNHVQAVEGIGADLNDIGCGGDAGVGVVGDEVDGISALIQVGNFPDRTVGTLHPDRPTFFPGNLLGLGFSALLQSAHFRNDPLSLARLGKIDPLQNIGDGSARSRRRSGFFGEVIRRGILP